MIARVARHMRTVEPVLPSDMGKRAGLAYSLWLPEKQAPRGGVVILHGAGSCKENHHDFARAALAAGFAAVAFDQRGHGASDGPMDDRVLEDVDVIASLLRAVGGESLPLALRGSSMGGYLAILAAPLVRARAVVAICPASAEGLRRGLAAGTLHFEADRAALDRVLAGRDLHEAVASLSIPLLLLHAEGDEVVPVEHSRELAQAATAPGSRLIALPGGHHRSVQHDPELRAVTLRFLERAFSDRLDR
jgi:alpha-beta hydrolase superfamily lysophospholipase